MKMGLAYLHMACIQGYSHHISNLILIGQRIENEMINNTAWPVFIGHFVICCFVFCIYSLVKENNSSS